MKIHQISSKNTLSPLRACKRGVHIPILAGPGPSLRLHACILRFSGASLELKHGDGISIEWLLRGFFGLAPWLPRIHFAIAWRTPKQKRARAYACTNVHPRLPPKTPNAHMASKLAKQNPKMKTYIYTYGLQVGKAQSKNENIYIYIHIWPPNWQSRIQK